MVFLLISFLWCSWTNKSPGYTFIATSKELRLLLNLSAMLLEMNNEENEEKIRKLINSNQFLRCNVIIHFLKR